MTSYSEIILKFQTSEDLIHLHIYLTLTRPSIYSGLWSIL